MKRKKTNTSKHAKKVTPRLRTFQEERDERLGLRFKPIDNEYLKELGDQLIEWAKDRTAKERVSLERFYEEKNICDKTFRAWRKREPYLDSCTRMAKLIIGNRLEEGLLYKTMSEKGTMYQLHHYKERWEKMDKYHTDLRNVKDAMAQLLGVEFEVPPLEDSK